MSEFPLISVVMPAFNAAAFIGDAIQSALAQTYLRLEVIVVDDGSTDGTAQIVRDFAERVALIQKSHQGIAKTRNAAIAAAGGEMLAFLDADDLWLPEKLERQTSYLFSNPQLDMVFSAVRQFADPRGTVRLDPRYETMQGKLASTMLIRRGSFERAGWFDPQHLASEFVAWVLQAEAKGLTSDVLPEVLTLRRLHDNNNGLRQRDLQSREYLALLKRRLDQRRRDGD
ncbi:MAG: glycosyltransferase family 2 protein [Chloroflexi bacterium]|nr:glycosyltransferase family 2 protein [Chloroflexota bacterium]